MKMKNKKFDKPKVIEYKIHSQENCTFLITVNSVGECMRYIRLIPKLVECDLTFKRPDLVKDIIFKNFKNVHIAKE